MKGIFKKGMIVACIAALSLTTIDCKKDKKDDTGLLLAALYFLNQTEYTVSLTATLLDSTSNIAIRDGLVTLTAGATDVLVPGQTSLSDFTGCQTDAPTIATQKTTNGLDGEFVINFKVSSSGTFTLTSLGSTGANTTTSCSNIANLAASTFTDAIGSSSMTLTINESDLNNVNQVAITSTGHTINVKSISIIKKGSYNLVNPTVGERTCDGNNLAGGPVTKSGTISASETWSGGILLSGTVNVNNGAVITVAPGTVVFGQRGSSLFFTGGASVVANGTAEAPVCFTSAATPGSRFPGDWGGIVMVGNGFNTRNSTGQTEGTTPVAYPGSSNSASRLVYTIIEFAGNEVAPGDELNNLSMYAVNNSGSGEALQYVQVHRGLDDGFEWWGGTISGKYLVATGGLDDDFDADEGYGVNSSGTSTASLTNLIAIKYPSACGGSFSTDPHSFEMDGANSGTGRQTCITAGNGTNPTGTDCLSNPTVTNFTLIGQNQVGGSGMRLREGLRGSFSNGLIWNFYGPAVECTSNSGFPNSGVTMATSVYAGQSGAVTNSGSATCNNVQATLTALPITTLGNLADSGCGFASTKPDFTSLSSLANKGAQNSDSTKWWDGWTVYRAR